MKQFKNPLRFALILMGMCALILDSQAAIIGARKGIHISISTIIPALFPFIFLSKLLISRIQITHNKVLTPIANLCGIPKGGELLLIASLLGGYPVGANCISHAYRSNQLTQKQAERLLGFCNNAGPAFVFGIGLQLFSSPIPCIIMWAIHIISALLVGYILPNREQTTVSLTKNVTTVTNCLKETIAICSIISGWVLIFHVIISLIEKWLFWALSEPLKNLLLGFFELSTGCINLSSMESLAERFILMTTYIGFGGICVVLQTMGIINNLNIFPYVKGKALQSAISFIVATLISPLIFKVQIKMLYYVLCVLLGCFLVGYMLKFRIKKRVAIPDTVVYNN